MTGCNDRSGAPAGLMPRFTAAGALIAIVLWSWAAAVPAGEITEPSGDEAVSARCPREREPDCEARAENDAAAVRFRTRAIIGTGIAGVIAYGASRWWQDGLTGEFRTQSEGWFGRDTASGGSDKLGHAFFSYASTRLLTGVLKEVGNDPAASLAISAMTVAATMTAVEVVDGYSRKWSFSWEDALMNIAGVSAALLMERYPGLDDALDLRVRYRRSEVIPGQRNSFAPFGDYSGQTYFLVVKGSGLSALKNHPVSRYLEFAVGYNARGFDEQLPNPERRLYYGIGLNLGALLEDTLLKGAGRRTRAVSRTFFEYVQVPGTQWLGKDRF